jgi:hypothetical protein
MALKSGASATAVKALPQWLFEQALDGYGEGRDTSLRAIIDPEECRVPDRLTDLDDLTISWAPVERSVRAIELLTE